MRVRRIGVIASALAVVATTGLMGASPASAASGGGCAGSSSQNGFTINPCVFGWNDNNGVPQVEGWFYVSHVPGGSPCTIAWVLTELNGPGLHYGNFPCTTGGKEAGWWPQAGGEWALTVYGETPNIVYEASSPVLYP